MFSSVCVVAELSLTSHAVVVVDVGVVEVGVGVVVFVKWPALFSTTCIVAEPSFTSHAVVVDVDSVVFNEFVKWPAVFSTTRIVAAPSLSSHVVVVGFNGFVKWPAVLSTDRTVADVVVKSSFSSQVVVVVNAASRFRSRYTRVEIMDLSIMAKVKRSKESKNQATKAFMVTLKIGIAL